MDKKIINEMTMECKKRKHEEIDETKVRMRKETMNEILQKERKEEKKAKYMEWGKGLIQNKMRNEKLQEDLEEAVKPLARYIHLDKDLDKVLREKERDDDPMLKYIKQTNKVECTKEKKEFNGPAPAPNHFGIKPGYRWDGVDRTNGFEKTYFQSLSRKKIEKYQTHKWSVEDI